MPATHTPTEPTRSRGGVIALVVVGVVIMFLVVGVALAAVLGLFVVTSSSGESPPVVVEDETVPAPLPVPAPDGETFGFVTAVDAASVTFDPARMLSGQEAREAATADGVIGPGEDLPNDFYIDNPDADLLTLPVTDDLQPTVLGFDSGGSLTETDITLSELAVAFTGEYPGVAIYGLVAGEFPMTVIVKEGTVVEMTQVYLP